jgi:hypothetical protein
MSTHDEKIAKLSFTAVYPIYVAKVERKGRTVAELNLAITWLTGFDEKELQSFINENISFDNFFQQATLNTNAHLITGVICGYRVEEIENPLS